MVTYGNCSLVMNPDTKKSMQRISIAEHRTLSAVINDASELYIKEYLKKQEQKQEQVQVKSMMDKIKGNERDGRHNTQLSENAYWNLKKAAFERNMTMMDLVEELVDAYIQNNKQLNERGIVITK